MFVELLTLVYDVLITLSLSIFLWNDTVSKTQTRLQV